MRIMIASFSIGLIAATVVLGTTYYVESDSDEAVVEQSNKLNEENAKELLDELEYTVVEADKSNQLINENESLLNEINELEKENEAFSNKIDKLEDEIESLNQSNEDDDTTNGQGETEDRDEENSNSQVIEYSLTISSGMTSIDLTNELEREGIIDDSEAFSDYLENNDYNRIIQLGTYDVSSNSTYQELALLITGN